MLRVLASTLASSVLLTSAPALATQCAMTPQEKGWIEKSLAAWDHVRVNRLKIRPLSIPLSSSSTTDAASKPKREAIPAGGRNPIPA